MCTIRPANTKDIPVIRKLAFEIWPISYGSILKDEQLNYMLQLFYSEAALRSQMEENKHCFLLAIENEQPVAFASYNQLENHQFHLQKIYVLPQMHGKGYGKKLIQYIIQEIKKQSAAKLTLHVNKHNPALDFYKHMGFTIQQSLVTDIGKGFVMDDYVLELDVMD